MSFLLIIFLGVLANLALAQDTSTTYSTTTTTTTERTTSTARAGIKGGLNASNLYVDDVDDENARFGFNVGLYAQLFSSEVFAIQPELLYSTKGTKTTYDNALMGEGDAKFNLNYLEVPVLAVIKLGGAAELHIGPYWSYLLNANIDIDGDTDTFDELDRDNFTSWDFGIAGGVGLNFGATQIGVRYSKGLRKLENS
ncbi:MAG TPA: porin family protein, partial [Cyclobacteriaceae bacterium]|nr:porin family protein [Cyclobacteriaceae bacterium]